ncbi:hypothetical protein DL89DRAFT_310734 [Linderina pennispora]|uniref:Uncharacterized protein n=1 Tax=Linderina pennispora TaxID=61395 RepID=A0A1Y1VXV6_9FUNG|nr:uncharacterized protein DL89DRAFT_310734 [Linderina pennispora]ORX65634.1 hypothetical protein DL89DRAFT_310734 [Linderina pennispora]
MEDKFNGRSNYPYVFLNDEPFEENFMSMPWSMTEGGFFYERWGDSPVHSISAAMFLQKEEVHWFEDIGYLHPGWQHCPSGDAWLKNRRTCDPNDDGSSDTITKGY